jgi:3'-5' exonuclease
MVALPKPVEPEAFVAELHPNVAAAYEMGDFVYFDIETIPDQRDGALERARENVKHPANLKKPDSIDLWYAENRESAAHDVWAKTSFDPGAGHVCTIGWAINDGDVRVEHAEGVTEERDIIAAFFDALPLSGSVLVGHNIVGFDIPFLLKRAVVLGIDLPPSSTFPRDPKPWAPGVFDTMNAWAGSGRGDMISMNRLCGIFGIVGKAGFDGSMVAEAWTSGQHLTIAQYCDDDVRRTRALHQKFLQARF